MPSTAGSRVLEGYTPPYDATAVRKIKELGGIVVGKTNLDETGMGSTTEGSAFQVHVCEGSPFQVLEQRRFSVKFDGNLRAAQSDPGNVSYINGKLEESSFQNISQIIESYFVEEVMAIRKREGHSAENWKTKEKSLQNKCSCNWQCSR
ncbi:hypothetical protein ACLB2K_012546 [Fragaria x ananassa]